MPVGRPKKDQVRLTFGNTAECSACRLRSGLIFLAFHKQAAIKPILKNELARMEEPKPSTPELAAIADTVRREGFAWIDGQVFHGYRAIAAPIFDIRARYGRPCHSSATRRLAVTSNAVWSALIVKALCVSASSFPTETGPRKTYSQRAKPTEV
jgi:hypothetical protein